MHESHLQFPDAARSELESSITDLVARADRVLVTQGRLRGLLNASRDVLEELDLERVLKRIAEAAVALVDAQYGALGVIHPDGHLERFIHVGIPDDDARAIGDLPQGHGLLGAVIDSGEPIRLDHLDGDPRSSGFPPHHPPMGSFLGVPIRVRDAVYGNLYLTNRRNGLFTDEDEELVGSLAATAGIAIENARRYEESTRRQRLSDALSEVATALLSPGTGDVLGVVAERVASIVPASLVLIVIPAPTEGKLLVETARGIAARDVEGLIYPAHGSVAGRAITAGTVTVADSIPAIEEGAEQPLFEDRIRLGPTIAAPLIVSGNPIGALCVARDPGDATFTSSELATVSEFAVQAGIAIALAWARRDRQRLDVIEDHSRIARDLHDHVIQRLFGTGLGLQALAASDPSHAVEIDAHISEIDAAIADIRSAIFTLANRTTAAGPLARHRLLDVVTEFSPALETAPRITFAGAVDLMLTGTIADDVIAVVRECLANVARHANATTTTVDVTVNATEIAVTVDDDGDGVNPANTRASGTKNLADRAQAHRGTFTLQPRDSGGTRARWSVPLPSGAQK